mmetsp:Transcript_32768/g.71555  ORF Transcript_32768/g.71555 Transcript_32768/m.71555 type:complete len:226 (-) Transcript_32768:974-1651(-)
MWFMLRSSSRGRSGFARAARINGRAPSSANLLPPSPSLRRHGGPLIGADVQSAGRSSRPAREGAETPESSFQPSSRLRRHGSTPLVRALASARQPLSPRPFISRPSSSKLCDQAPAASTSAAAPAAPRALYPRLSCRSGCVASAWKSARAVDSLARHREVSHSASRAPHVSKVLFSSSTSLTSRATSLICKELPAVDAHAVKRLSASARSSGEQSSIASEESCNG